MENWKIIESHPDYMISDLGRVKSMKFGTGKILKAGKNLQGYFHVTLSKDKKTSNKLVSRLVAIEFIPNTYGKRTVNHKNGIITDNRVENLEWMTFSENHKHAYRKLGRKAVYYKWSNELKSKFFSSKGHGHPRSKAIIQYELDGNKISDFGSLREAERLTGVYHSHISQCALQHTRYKTAGGYIWKYK